MHSSQQQSSILSSAKPATIKWVCKTRRKCTTFSTVLQPLPEAICELTTSHSLAVLCHAQSLRARVQNAESAGPDVRLSVALQHVNCRFAPVPVWRTLRQDADHTCCHSLPDKPCMHYLHDRVTASTCVATTDGWLSIICVSTKLLRASHHDMKWHRPAASPVEHLCNCRISICHPLLLACLHIQQLVHVRTHTTASCALQRSHKSPSAQANTRSATRFIHST